MSTVEKINHYKRSILNPQSDHRRLTYCICKLSSLPVTVGHLQQTGIGKTVNALRKHEHGVGDAARTLVKKWKNMVHQAYTSEDEDEACVPDVPESYESPSPVEDDDSEGERQQSGKRKLQIVDPSPPPPKKPVVEDSDDNSDHQRVSSSRKSYDLNQASTSREEHWKERHQAWKALPDSTTPTASEAAADEESVQESNESEKKCDKETGEGSKKHKSSRKDKHSTSKSKETKTEKKPTSSNESCKNSNSDKTKSNHSSSKSKSHKPSKKRKSDVEKGIDGNSGTSFADALGMCTMPLPKKKKKDTRSDRDSTSSSSSRKSHKPSSSSSSSKKKKKDKMELPDSSDPLLLLSSKAKLEPLDVDIDATLPEISVNYKPLPLIMPSNSIQRKQEEEKLLRDAIHSKNLRTKVYSGNKSGYSTLPTLYDLCIRVLIENIDALEFTGGVPYYIIKPVLERATAEQLFMLEHYNPYLIEDTDELWKYHCSKDFKTSRRMEDETWREMYLRCLEERETKLKQLTENFKQSKEKQTPVKSTKLAYVDHVVKPPRNILRQQAKFGTANEAPVKTQSDIKKKLITSCLGGPGGSSSSSSSSSSSLSAVPVPIPLGVRARQAISNQKKAKAPLMAKALQAIKGARFKR